MTRPSPRPADVIREEIEDLVSYLEGLPDPLRRSGAMNAYEARLHALQRELMMVSMVRKAPAPRSSDRSP